MKLLLITNRYPVDADDHASPFVPHFVSALVSSGVQVDVLTPDYTHDEGACKGGPESRPDSERVDVNVFRFVTGSATPVGSWNLLNPLSLARLARFMKNGQTLGDRLCSANRYDHILALWALPSGHFAQTLSRQFQVPYSVWCLGSDIYTWARRRVIGGRIANILKNAAHVFGDGEDLCGRINAWLGIDAIFLPSFRPLAGLDGCQPPRPTESPRYLYLGRIHRAKGIFELLTSFAHVRMALPLATLEYVGDGPDKEELEETAAEMCLYRQKDPDAGSVHIRGAVSNEGVVRAMRDCDFVVIPTKSDSIPLVFTEAVQAMRPVIGTDVGDLGTLIRRYKVGHVVGSMRNGDLAATMVRASHQPLFDPQGRTALLDLFDSGRAAKVFCDHAMPTAPSQVSSKQVDKVGKMSPV